MKKKIWISIGAVLSVCIVLMAFVFTKCYWVSKEDSYVPYSGAADLYNASREELIELDFCDYEGKFGEVKNAKQAAKIAAKVVREVYEDDEYPYIVKYNENADAWIVHGTLLTFLNGGVASVAIDKNTGEILMLIHTK